MSDTSSRSQQAAPTGAYHPELMAAAVHRYREPRIDAGELLGALSCSVSGTAGPGGAVTAFPVLNLSSGGMAVSADLQAEVNSVVERVTLRFGERVVFAGPARVTYHIASNDKSVFGLSFSGSRIDAAGLMQESRLTAKLRSQLARVDQQQHRLPLAWRAAVSDLRHLLDSIERMLNESGDRELERPDDTRMIAIAFEAWAPRLHAQLVQLHALSKDLDAEARPVASEYAYRMLWPLLQSCPMHRRAHDKPRGYAGDYRMMLLYFAREYEGPTRYSRFLQYSAQRYSLGRAVIERQECLRTAIRSVLANRDAAAPEKQRIVSLASGPALELASALAEGDLRGPLELVLIDQDEEALAYAHGLLTRRIDELASKNPGVPHGIELTCINMSVKQLLSPKSDVERSVIAQHVSQAALIYCSGLYDYLPEPVAERLTLALYAQLRPGGRVYLGNLVEAPDTSWMMDYVLDWKLLYREEADMLRLATKMSPAPVELTVDRDTSGYAIFLNAKAP